MKKSILPYSNIKYNFSSHFKNRLWIIPVKWMKANYCMWCCPLNSEGAWWGMLHQGPRMLSQPKRKHKHTPGPDNCQWNKLISSSLLKKEKKNSPGFRDMKANHPVPSSNLVLAILPVNTQREAERWLTSGHVSAQPHCWVYAVRSASGEELGPCGRHPDCTLTAQAFMLRLLWVLPLFSIHPRK